MNYTDASTSVKDIKVKIDGIWKYNEKIFISLIKEITILNKGKAIIGKNINVQELFKNFLEGNESIIIDRILYNEQKLFKIIDEYGTIKTVNRLTY